MRSRKRVIALDDFEHNLLINGFNEFRNMLLEEEKPTEDVDELLLKIIDAPLEKDKRRSGFEAR